jgi:hypothetical protein
VKAVKTSVYYKNLNLLVTRPEFIQNIFSKYTTYIVLLSQLYITKQKENWSLGQYLGHLISNLFSYPEIVHIDNI